MPSTPNPPQLQLSLGHQHQAFKRSFTQFGLDVDDVDDGLRSGASSDSSRSGSSGSSTSDSSTSSLLSTPSASGNTSGSIAGSYAYGSQRADVLGYQHHHHDGERGERSKRARSEGPERDCVSASAATSTAASTLASAPAATSSGPSALSLSLSLNPEVMNGPSFQSLSGDSAGPVLDISATENLNNSSGSPTYRSNSNYSTSTSISSGYTLPVLDFGPSTPSVAEFVALHSSSSPNVTTSTTVNGRPVEHRGPPGFSNMLSPRSSSPAPPPAVALDMDVAMDDDTGLDLLESDDEDPIDLLRAERQRNRSRSRMQLADAGTSNRSANSGSGPRSNLGIGSRTMSTGSSSFLDTARSDAALNAATERLRASIERSRTFDRLLAPLRSGDANGATTSGGSARTGPSTGVSSASRPRTGVLRSILQQRQRQTQAQRQDVQGYTRPRLPPFDFERNRRQSPFPLRTDSNVGATNALSPRVTGANRYALRRPLSPTIPLTPIDVNGIADAHGNDDMAEQDDFAEVESESEEEEDDIVVDRELTVDPEANDGTDSISSSMMGSSGGLDVDENIRDAMGNSSRPSIPLPLSLSISESTHSFGDMVRDINSAASQISNVGAEQDNNNNIATRSRFESLFGNEGLDARSSVEQVGTGSASNAGTRLQAALSGARMAGLQTSPSVSTMHTNSMASEPFRFGPSTSTWTSSATPSSPSTRPFPSLRLRPTSWGRSRGTGAEQDDRVGSTGQVAEQEEASPIRFGGWPWDRLLNSPVTDGQSSLGSAVSAGMHAQPQAETREDRFQAESPLLQLRPQSPLFPFSLLSNPGPGSGPTSTLRADNSEPSGSVTATSPFTLLDDVDSEMRRIERMVEMDMESTDSTSTSSSSTLASATGSGGNTSTLDATSDLDAENFMSSSFVPFHSQPRPSQSTSSRLSIAETPSLLRRPTSGAMNAGSARLPFAPPQHASTLSQSRARPNLPTLRSAILEPLSDDSLAEWLGTASEDSSSRDSATAASISPNLSLSGLGSRHRVIRDEHNASRPTRTEVNVQLREAVARRQRELSMSRIGRATDEDDRSLPPIHASRTNLNTLRAMARQNANTRLAGSGSSSGASHSNLEQLSTSNMPLRDLMREAREDMERRRRLQNWFPPILEEERIRQAETNRDRGRARERFDRFIEMQQQLRQQRLSASERAPGWVDPESRHDLPQAQTRGQEDDLGLRWTDNWDNLLGPGNPDSNDAAPRSSTSTEAAAFFASGTSRTSSRQHQPERSSSDLQRQRRASLLWDFDGDAPLDLVDNSWDNVEMNWDASVALDSGLGSNVNRSSPRLANATSNRIPEHRGIPRPREDPLQLLFSERRLQDADGDNTGRRNNTGGNANTTLLGRAPQNPEFADLPALEQSRVGMWNLSEPRPGNAATQGRANNAHDSVRRSSSLRAASRPPSLPPLQFDSLPGLTGRSTEDDNANVGNGFLNVPGSEGRRSLQTIGPFPRPWNRPSADRRVDGRLGESTADTARSDTRNVLQRSNDLAMHHAIMLRSVQARQALRESEQRVRDSSTANTSARYSPGRPQGFQQTMNVLNADGMNNNTRQRFNNAFERERGHLQERPLAHQARNEAHVRWGEITDDTDASRPSALTASGHSPRQWVETLRARRRSMSALFAPPPENTDTLPPNRARGTGTAGGIGGTGGPGGHTHAHSPSAQAAQSDWFSMNSSNRARFRNRARLGRTNEDPSPLPFLRLGRNRPRNLGDFMRDEDFDTSYESLLALAATLGDVKPRSTPAHVIAALPTGLYKDWQSPGCDLRCPICLDDYRDVDPLLKAEPCNHWCHKECFEQWLHTASTCPVCRTKITPSQRVSTPSPVAGPSRLSTSNNTPNAGLPNLGDIHFLDDSDDDFESIFRLREDHRSQRNTVGWTRSPPPR